MKIKLTKEQYNRLLTEELSDEELDDAGVLDAEEMIDFSEKMKPGGVATDFIEEFISTHPLWKWEAPELPYERGASKMDVYYIKDKGLQEKQYDYEPNMQDYHTGIDLIMYDRQYKQIGGWDAIVIYAEDVDEGTWDKIKGIFKDPEPIFDRGRVQTKLAKLIEDEIKEHGEMKWFKEFDKADFKMLSNVLYEMYMKKVDNDEVFIQRISEPSERQQKQISKNWPQFTDKQGVERNYPYHGGYNPNTPKKVKITESQYNRLLTEDTQWGRLTDKVTPFIVKLFKLIENKLPANSPLNSKIKFLRDIMALPINEALIVAYTYEQFYKENITNWDNLIGRPLQFKGIYQFTADVPITADIYGRGYGEATLYAMAGSREEALENAIHNESLVADESSIVDDDIDWDMDYDNIDVQYDMLADQLNDGRIEGEEGGNPFTLSTDISNYTLHDLIING